MNLRIGLIIVSCLFAGIYLPAQNPCIRHYTTADGLPSNTVYYVFQDSRKFIWFATDAGVARYDGSHFDYYQKRDGLSSNEVVRIQEDTFGRIWFFNLNGTINFFYHNTIYNELNAPFLDSLKSKEFFRRFFEDEDKTLYFYYNHQRDIVALDSLNNITKYKIPSVKYYDPYVKDSTEWMVIRYISKTETGDFILWTLAGIFKLKHFNEPPTLILDNFHITNVFPLTNRINYNVGTFTPCDSYNIVKFSHERLIDTILSPLKIKTRNILISSILEDNSGFLWISTFEEGLYCLKDKHVIRHFEVDEGQALMQDHENNIWISSMYEGVFKISPFMGFVKHYDQTASGLSGITALDVDPAGGVWCTDGDRISLFRDDDFYRMDFKNKGGPFNRIRFLENNSLLVWQKGTPCFLLKGIQINPETKKIFYKTVTRSLYNKKEFVLNHSGNELATFDHFCLFISSPDHLTYDSSGWINLKERIYNVFYNRNNELIVNAKKNYIYRNGNPEVNKELTCFENKIITDHIFLGDSIELFNIDGESLYLLSCNGLSNLTASFSHPLNLQIKQIAYEEPRLYVATASHVYFCDYPTDCLRGKPVHLQPIDLSFRDIHDILIQNRSLYIASDDGLTVIPDTLIHDIKTYLPIPYFQSILINDQETDPEQDRITLKGNHRINMVFGSNSYSDWPIIYSYMLEGADHDWIFGSGTNVVYQNLPPGKYVFKVRARKPTSAWTEPVEYRITIKATFWQHPLFFVGLSLLFAIMVALVIIRRKNLQLKRLEIDHQLITLEQKALQSMMNPHFVFNALSSMQSYLLMDKSREAGLYLSQFARLIRQNLSALNSPMIGLDEEIDRLKNYLDLEQLRMSDGFDYTIELDESVEDEEITIPSMIIQPFAENAIIHGISRLDRKGTIRILLSMHSEKSLMIIIEDNGIGLQHSGTASDRSEKHLHLGMGMTRKRLEILGKKMNVETSIEFSEAFPGSPNPGTRVVIVVPVGN
ncbi:MAG: histidine kinase [Bacteroidales bacterium]|nr:histidine kinase [Bacteroidales bacterium]